MIQMKQRQVGRRAGTAINGDKASSWVAGQEKKYSMQVQNYVLV